MNSKRAIYTFRIFEFSIFLFSKLAIQDNNLIQNNNFYHWNFSKLYLQNMDEITLTHEVGPEKSKI